MVMWKCGSLSRSGRRRRRKRVSQSSETYSQISAALLETEVSLVSMVFPAVRRKPKPTAEFSRTAFNEAQAVEVKVGVQELAARLQRPKGEKERITKCQTATSSMSVNISTLS